MVYGDIAMDISLQSPALSSPLPGQDAEVEDIGFEPGGSAANCAVIAARLGTPTTFMGFVGTDPFGLQLLTDLKVCDVTIDFIQQVPGKSGVTVALIDAAGERTFYSYRGVNRSGVIPLLEPNLFNNIKILHLSGYSFQDENSRNNASALIEGAHQHGVSISLDPSYWYAKKYHHDHPQLLTKIDILLPNLEEARLMSGKEDPEEACLALHELGPKVVIVKLGDGGCLLSENHQIEHIPAFPIDQVVDTTGAGDAFCGGFLAGVLKGLSAAEAAVIGNAVASRIVASAGGHKGAPGLEEVLEILGKNQQSELVRKIEQLK